MIPNKKRQLSITIVLSMLATSSLWLARHVFEHMRAVDTVLVMATGILIGVWLSTVAIYVFGKD